MTLTMAYLLVIAALLGLAALVGERICAELDWPRRGAWLVALGGSLALPAFSYVYGATPTVATPFLSLPPLFDAMPAMRGGIDVAAAGRAEASALQWPDWDAFDSALATLWIVSSGALLLCFGLAGLRVRRIAARAPALGIGDQTVLLSDRLGPAVLGFLRPRIMLPRWLAEQSTALRSQVLQHEREHIAAHDQLALIAALLLVAAMPWNVALWWQFRRLRAAIEVDCDGRVLRAGADPREYSQALLTVGQRARRAPFAAVALTEPVSELERRIRIMLTRARDFSLAGFGARSAVVASLLGLALAVNAPKAQQAGGRVETAAATKVIPTMRLSISEQFEQAQRCIDRDDMACAHRVLDELAEIPDLNAYEAGQVQNFRAFVSFEEDNLAEAIAGYEAILALPQNALPDGLISSSMRNLAMLYLQADRLQDGLDLYDRWLDLPFINGSGNDYYLRATILYQLERYPDAIAETEKAIAASDEPRENWYQLLYALQAMTDDQAAASRTLEILNTRWPNEERLGTADAVALAQSRIQGIGFGVSDGEYLPIVIVKPTYPPRARARGLEGYVVVSFTVTARGDTDDVEVVESSATLFENAAIEAAKKYKYKPRVVDGKPVDVAGVTSRIEFVLPNDEAPQNSARTAR